ncbi:unnamed protein product [Lactuca saligna]|uniref:Uncharacterized protein n=1 Tax=Lactuca saligna TaxID=75948 RepID=A0AA36E3I3_LACSI|nr:unnamed protein product [Lactuca saligna]
MIRSFIEDSGANIKISPQDHNYIGLNDRLLKKHHYLLKQLENVSNALAAISAPVLSDVSEHYYKVTAEALRTVWYKGKVKKLHWKGEFCLIYFRSFLLINVIEQVKLMEERNMKPLDLNLAALSARCSKDLELNLAKSLLSEMGQCTTAYPYNQLFGALVLKNYERQDATLLSWNLMYIVD